MATITPTILQNNERKNGTWNVVYRLTHKRKSVYIKTSHVVGRKNLDKDKSIKSKFIIDYLSMDIREYQHRISLIGLEAERMTAAQIKEIITAETHEVDFLEFADEYYQRIKKTLKVNTVSTYRTVINHLKDFCGTKPLMATSITSGFVRDFMSYLQSDKNIIRKSGNNAVQKITSGIESNNSLYTMYFRFQKIFNECKLQYNNEDIGLIRIPQNPFARVPAPKMQMTKKRYLSVEEIRNIRDYQPVTWAELAAKNIFLLSFYLCGANMVDIKRYIHQAGERLSYNRTKVENKRRDQGFISIKVPDIAKPYVKWLQSVERKWGTSRTMMALVNSGLSAISEALELDKKITSYYARHSFATIARNDCRCPKEDIAMAMNHIDQSTKITDIYLAPDWSIIDEVQSAVIRKINEDFKD